MSKRDKFSYENRSIIMHDVRPSDGGDYVWVCDSSYTETVVRVKVTGMEIL